MFIDIWHYFKWVEKYSLKLVYKKFLFIWDYVGFFIFILEHN